MYAWRVGSCGRLNARPSGTQWSADACELTVASCSSCACTSRAAITFCRCIVEKALALQVLRPYSASMSVSHTRSYPIAPDCI